MLEVYEVEDNLSIAAMMCFSSGTSGKPKGVLLSHYNLIAYMLTLRSTTPSTTNIRSKEVFFPSCMYIMLHCLMK